MSAWRHSGKCLRTCNHRNRGYSDRSASSMTKAQKRLPSLLTKTSETTRLKTPGPAFYTRYFLLGFILSKNNAPMILSPQSSFTYRKWSIRGRGAYSRAEFISTTGKTRRGIERELSKARTRYAQFNIKYVHLELLYEPGFKSFPTLKLKNSRVGRGLIS